MTPRLLLALLAPALALHAGCVPAAPGARYVHYDINKDAPKSDVELLTIGAASEVLATHPRLSAGIIGHASSDGLARSNRDLSLRRAERVRDLLVARGIAASRLTVAARGADQPVASNDTEEGRELNRRVEIYFYDPDRGDLQTQYGVKLSFRIGAEGR